MKLLTRRRLWSTGIAVAGVCLAMGVSMGTSFGATPTKITLTEEDYFSTPGQIAALNAYSKQFEAAHPGVTITRQAVPFASLDTKLLTQATGRDLPNLLAVDNPFVTTMIATGQVAPLSGLKGFSTKGYFKAIVDEGLQGGKYYSLPVAGANSVALIYNIKDLKQAGVSPPKTWAQLQADATKLTTSNPAAKGGHYGIALTCEAAEDTTWQWEPFFWGNGGSFNFSNVGSAKGVQALTLWANMVKDGSASKACLNWSQTPAASSQFIAGKAAMMVNGPWNFPTFNQAHQFYGKQFGVVPIPTNKPGQKSIVPLGGEDWMVSKTGGTQAEQLSFDYIKGLQTPAEQLKFANLFGYLPSKIAVANKFLKQAGPEWKVYVHQTMFAHPRTLDLGTKYPKISQAVWTAIQSALAGQATPQDALQTAQSTIEGVLKG